MIIPRSASWFVVLALLAWAAGMCVAQPAASLPAVPPAHDGAPPIREPLDLIPADSLLTWYGRTLPAAAEATDEPSTLQTLFELGTRLATTGTQTGPLAQFGVRIAEMFGQMIRYPHALALIDARARPVQTDPQARRVDRLQCALVVRTDGRNDAFLRIIQKVVNEQTDATQAHLTTRTAANWKYQELRDQRLPPWAVIAWGSIDGHFVLTLGAGVWPRIASAAAGHERALSDDPWYAAARLPRRDDALIEIFLTATHIRERLDPFVQGRASAFFDAWDAGHLKQAHWALGLQGRALFCRAGYRVGDRTEVRIYADPDDQDPRLLATVPPGAHYAIYDLPLARFLRRFFHGFIVLQGAKPRANIDRIWRETQAAHGFDVDHNLLRNLGRHVVLHNVPPHPLGVPLAVTGLIEIRRNPADVQATIDTMFTVFRDALTQAKAEDRGPPPWTFHRDDDGLWYVRYGPVAGPAWKVVDHFLVFSWSPLALRQYLDLLGDEVRLTPP